MADTKIKTEIDRCMKCKAFKDNIETGDGWAALCIAVGYLEANAPEISALLNTITRAGLLERL